MRKLLTWIVVTLGIAALIRRLRRREAEPEPTSAGPPAGDPADELRQKLAESRSADEAEEPPPPPAEATVEDRRADVHDQGRATLDEMRPSDEEQ